MEDEWAPLPKPPAYVAYGGPVGDAKHELLDASALEAQLHFELIAVVVAASPELQRSLPLENLPIDALPADFLPEVALLGTFVDAVRGGLCHEASLVYVAPDAYGGHGLFAAVDLPKHALVGEYVGALQRGVCALSDPYLMCYPSAPGALYLSGKDAGSLMRFVNHAPLGDPANNCKCVGRSHSGRWRVPLVPGDHMRRRGASGIRLRLRASVLDQAAQYVQNLDARPIHIGERHVVGGKRGKLRVRRRRVWWRNSNVGKSWTRRACRAPAAESSLRKFRDHPSLFR